MDEPGKVGNPSHGQLNRENKYYPAPICACEFGLATRVQPSRPASACSLSILRLNLMLTHGIPTDVRSGIHFFYLNRHTPLGQSRVHRVTQLRTNDVHCRESTGTGSVVHKVFPVTGAAFLQVSMDQLMFASFFPHPPLV